MGEVLGIGLTHYPPLSSDDDQMAGILRWTLQDEGIPAEAKDPAGWPAAMRAEWGNDEGRSAAPEHRRQLVEHLRRARAAIDEFDPDVVLIWGDDQYENFHEDVIPPYAVLAYDDMVVRPWADAAQSSDMIGRANVWNEPADTERTIVGAPDIARDLVASLLSHGIDVSYSYRPLHHPGLPHAFLNTILYLDYDRTGFDYPVIASPINCYGRHVVSWRGFLNRFSDPPRPLDPPSPNPSRLMDLGAATARYFASSDLRAVLVASSSWSHAFTCEATWHLKPDVEADRVLYRSLVAGDWDVWRRRTTDDIERAGQQELLNWYALVGAMEQLEQLPEWHTMIETYVFNSAKVFATFPPARGTRTAASSGAAEPAVARS